MVTVKELRKSGNKVRVLHHRNLLPDGTVFCKGGRTVVEVTTRDGLDLSGSSRCRDDERYNKKTGVRIALGRALTSAGSQP